MHQSNGFEHVSEFVDVEVSADAAANIIRLGGAPSGEYVSNLRQLGGKWHVSIPRGQRIVGFSPITGGPILGGPPQVPTSNHVVR